MVNLTDAEKKTLPKHLEPFCQPTAGSTMKLLAAWEGLSVETLLCLIEEIKDRNIPVDLKDHIFKKAFNSDNPYLRYVGFKYTNKLNRKEMEEQAANDPHPLVRSSIYEASPSYLNKEIYNPEQLFNLHQESRLAMMRGYVAWTDVNGDTGPDSHFCLASFQKNITEIIEYGVKQALPQQKTSESELYDLIREIFSTPTKTDFFSNIWNGFPALWKLTSIAPDHIAEFLLKHLPAKGAEELTEVEIQAMQPWQIETLILRTDIQLSSFREKLELQPEKNKYETSYKFKE